MPFTGFYVFGDSLVDAGNALKLANFYKTLTFSDLPEGAPSGDRGYFQGRFSNGYTFADLLSNKLVGAVTQPVFPFGYNDPWLGVPISPFAGDPSGKNLNFAYGGAQIIRGDEAVPDLDGQTDAFWNAVDNKPDPNSLYFFTIGGNEVRGLARYDADPVGQIQARYELELSAQRMIDELSLIVTRGAKNIVITGIPDVGLIPAYDVDRNGSLDGTEQLRASAATEYSIYLDSLLRTKVVPELQALGGNVIFAPIMDNVDGTGASHVGALNANLATIAALNGLTEQQLSNDLLHFQKLVFFDTAHPNANANALLAGYINAQITGSPWVETLPTSRAEADYHIAGTLSVAGEVDGFVFAMVAGTTYRFEALGLGGLSTPGSVADLTVRLLGPTGTAVANDDDSGVGFDATLTYAAAATGTHTLQLSAAGSLTGAYVLQAIVVAGAAAQAGNTYVVTSASTLVIEGIGGIGEDVIATSVSYALTPEAEIEVLRTSNDKGKTVINLTGNDFAQTLVGNAAANVLDGGAGNDILSGGAGNDRLIGGMGKDVFRDTAAGLNGDTIVDFGPGDTIVIVDARAATFSFSLSGTTLSYSGGKLSFGSAVGAALVASAASGGGVQLSLAASAAVQDARNDFNADGRSDLLLRNDSGGLTAWFASPNGTLTGSTSSLIAQVPNSWTIVGTADFNGDGRDDLLWRSDTGQISDWLATPAGGFAANDAHAFAQVPITWHVVGTGDFNGDGRDDVFWRSDAGEVSDWLGTASGGFAVNDANAFGQAPASAHIAGIGDFNGDGRDDLLWRSETGQVSTWLAQSNGGFVRNDAAAISAVPGARAVLGTGDFNGDGRDDVLWGDAGGALSQLLGTSSGGFIANDQAARMLPAGSRVEGVGDTNGDGRDDLLLRSASGGLSIGFAQSNGALVESAVGAMLGSEWHLQPAQPVWW